MLRRKFNTWFVCALASVLLLAAPIAVRLWQLISYGRQQRNGADMLVPLRSRRPEAVSAKTWEHATSWAVTAYHNVCFSEEHVTYDELVRFNHDVRKELEGEVSLQSIDWVWSRLAQTGPHGERYVKRFEPQYRSDVYREAPLESSR